MRIEAKEGKSWFSSEEKAAVEDISSAHSSSDEKHPIQSYKYITDPSKFIYHFYYIAYRTKQEEKKNPLLYSFRLDIS